MEILKEEGKVYEVETKKRELLVEDLEAEVDRWDAWLEEQKAEHAAAIAAVKAKKTSVEGLLAKK